MRETQTAITMQAAKTELKVAMAQLATVQARQQTGNLMDRRRFDDRAFTFLRGLRDRVGAMGGRHAALLAADFGRTPGEVAVLLDRIMLRLCERLAQSTDDPTLARALRPDPLLTVTQWADRHRMLSSRGAAEPGPYRSSRTPYLREIMDCLSVTSPVRRVVFKKCAQIGATEAGNCWVGYIIDQAPGPTLAVQPTVELAKRFSKQRIDPMVTDSPRLRERVAPSRARDSGNTVLAKEFPGGIIVMTGANSAVGLRSMPARYLFLDEVDGYPPDVDGEGDPISLAEARARTFSFRSKEFMASTPGLKGTSVISREYERSDQRRFFVPCPECGGEQVLSFDRLRMVDDEARYECEHCQHLIAEHFKTRMLAEGRWKPTAICADPHTQGYHLNALYSPIGWLSWTEIVRQWNEKASKSVDDRKAFINTVLGEAYEEETNPIPDWMRLYERREEWAHKIVPERGLFLTAGADVQLDRIEVDIWAWGRGLESWLVEHRVLYGDPGKTETWAGLSALLGETWEHETGERIGLARLAVDTGAFTQSVYLWARTQDRAVVVPVKGVPQYDRLVPVSAPTKVEVTTGGVKLRGGLNLWTVSVSFFKREFYKQLGLDKPTDEELAAGGRFPDGYVHVSTAASDEWMRQTVAEQPVIVRSRTGFAVRTEWRPLRPRNEALDMRVYARAATWLAGMDRWSDATWRDLEEQLGLDPLPRAPEPAKAAPEPQQQPVAGRLRGAMRGVPPGMRAASGQMRRPIRNPGVPL